MFFLQLLTEPSAWQNGSTPEQRKEGLGFWTDDGVKMYQSHLSKNFWNI